MDKRKEANRRVKDRITSTLLQLLHEKSKIADMFYEACVGRE